MDKQRITDDLARVELELKKLSEAVHAYRAAPSEFSRVDPEYVMKALVGSSLQSIYTNIEAVLEGILKETDNYRPSGESHHKEVLERASSAVEGGRAPIISVQLKLHFVELLGFRHVARKRYAQEIDLRKALENVDRALAAVPLFCDEILRFVDQRLRWSSVADQGPASTQPGALKSKGAPLSAKKPKR
jgi:hypothetical protein